MSTRVPAIVPVRRVVGGMGATGVGDQRPNAPLPCSGVEAGVRYIP